jgi:hypothetical protein
MARVRLRAVDWAALIDEWRRSGLSLPAFCQRHGLSRGTMQNWVYKPALRHAVDEARRAARPPAVAPVRADGPPPPDPSPAFLPVRIVEVAAGHDVPDRSGVEIVLGAGRRVVVAAGFDSETLRRVLAVLEGRPC